MAPRTSNAKLRLAEAPGSLVTNSNSVEFDYGAISDAFPEIDPGLKPFGTFALFQIRHAKHVTKGGIILTTADRSTEYYNTQVAKCVALGDLCFKISRNVADPVTGQETEKLFPYAEGPWFKPGDFVRVPKYGGDRFSVPFSYEGTENGEKATLKDEVIFALFKAKDVLGLVTGNPLAVKAFYE